MSNWIKFRTSLIRDGRVKLASRNSNAKCVTVIGGLVTLWSLADEHADDEGLLLGWSVADVNSYLEIENFCESLPEDWIDLSGEFVKVPQYQEHNGSTGKNRAQAAKRSAAYRSRNASSVTGASPRIEKNRIDKNINIKKKNTKKKKELVKLGDVVAMSEKEINDLKAQDGIQEFNNRIKSMDDYCLAHGKKYKSYAAAYRQWRKRDGEKAKNQFARKPDSLYALNESYLNLIKGEQDNGWQHNTSTIEAEFNHSEGDAWRPDASQKSLAGLPDSTDKE